MLSLKFRHLLFNLSSNKKSEYHLSVIIYFVFFAIILHKKNKFLINFDDCIKNIMSFIIDHLTFVKQTCRSFMKKNFYFKIALIFLYYMLIKLNRLKKNKINVISLSDDVFDHIIHKYYREEKFYTNTASCALGIIDCNKPKPTWINICSTNSKKKYKIFVIPFSDATKNEIYTSETSLFNIEKLLNVNKSSSYFLVRTDQEHVEWAQEIKVSILSNPYECADDLIDTLLKNYFSHPRYLRRNDFINISIKKYAPEFLFTMGQPSLINLYFKVNNIKINNENTCRSCYVSRNRSTLIQESKTFEYLPPSYSISLLQDDVSNVKEDIKINNVNYFPFSSYKPFEILKASILPFMVSDDWKGLKPVFLIKGPSGCGKYKLINSVAKNMGFNFYNIDCCEIQTLSPSQTEAKLRMVFNHAQNSVPCILKLSNIQIFGKNSEGKIDERVTSSFSEQLNDLYTIKMKLPLIIIATLESNDIPLDISRNFIEQIQIDYLTQNERVELLDWFLKVHGIKYKVDFSKIASMCSDYTFYNIENLTLHTIKNYHKRISTEGGSCINDNDFTLAHNYLRSIFSSQIGAPKCPEVYWKDIGGLANLKHEIIRRIEIPLIHGFGVQSAGILFYGPPGTGKTLLAKAVATECKLNFLAVKGPELLNMYVGQSEKNVRDLFERARAASPCIIFFDELDALAPNRGRSGDSGGVMDRVVSQLLAEMDGLSSSAKTFIIGATNRPDLIDPALLRPGRFDKLLYIGVYSDLDSQLSVLQAITRKFHLADDVKLDDIVKSLPSNLTGADLQSLCSNAWLNASRNLIETYEKSFKSSNFQEKLEKINQKPKGPIKVCLKDFIEAMQILVPSISKEELIRYEKLHQKMTFKK